MSEIIAAIAGALITGLLAILTSKWDDLQYLFRPYFRSIDGNWLGVSYILHKGTIDETIDEQSREPEIKYTANLKQKGIKISGNMVMTQTLPGWTLYEHKYNGYIKNAYFVYDLTTIKPEQFRLSTAMLYISNNGMTMRGYFIANSGSNDPGHIILGYTIMNKIKH